MKNKKVIIIICSILCILLIIMFINRKDRFQKKLINYISKKDFIIDVGTLYKNKNNNLEKCDYNTSNNCQGQAVFFDTYSYIYYMNQNKRKDGVLFEFTPVYHYKNGEVSYSLRVTYQNGVIMYEGEYNKDKFTCEEEFSHGINLDKTNTCKYVKSELAIFYLEAESFIDNTYLLDKIKKER